MSLYCTHHVFELHFICDTCCSVSADNICDRFIEQHTHQPTYIDCQPFGQERQFSHLCKDKLFCLSYSCESHLFLSAYLNLSNSFFVYVFIFSCFTKSLFFLSFCLVLFLVSSLFPLSLFIYFHFLFSVVFLCLLPVCVCMHVHCVSLCFSLCCFLCIFHMSLLLFLFHSETRTGECTGR